jgi:hypothetical protein
MLRRPRFLAILAIISGTAPAAAGTPCLALRPTDVTADWSYAGAEAGHFDTPEGNVRVWYATSGKHATPHVAGRELPPAVTAAGAAAETALARYVELGFRRPAGDADSPCTDNGGNERLDLYLFDFNAADGTVLLESCDASAPEICSGFMLVENDFATGAYSSPLEGFRTVVPHELFHLVQSAYSANGEAWWSEGTAQWATQQVFPELRDLERLLPAFFQRTERALDFPAVGAVASFSYGAAIWPLFLAQRFNATLPLRIFEQLTLNGGSVLGATESALIARGAELGTTFGEFARWNAATGSRAGIGGYASAASYPEVELEPLDLPSRVSGKLAGLSARYFGSEARTRRTIQVSANASRLDAWFVPLSDGVAELERASRLPFVGDQAGVVVLSGRAVDHRDVAFTLQVTAAPDPLASDAGAGGAATAGDEPNAGSGNGGVPAGSPDDPDSAAGEPPSAAALGGASDQPPLRTPAPHHRPAGCSIVPGAPHAPQSLVAFLATSGVVLWSLRRTPGRRLVSRRSS